jgi:hypothetical protein
MSLMKLKRLLVSVNASAERLRGIDMTAYEAIVEASIKIETAINHLKAREKRPKVQPSPIKKLLRTNP